MLRATRYALRRGVKNILASVAQWSKRYSEDINMGVQFSPGAILCPQCVAAQCIIKFPLIFYYTCRFLSFDRRLCKSKGIIKIIRITPHCSHGSCKAVAIFFIQLRPQDNPLYDQRTPPQVCTIYPYLRCYLPTVTFFFRMVFFFYTSPPQVFHPLIINYIII